MKKLGVRLRSVTGEEISGGRFLYGGDWAFVEEVEKLKNTKSLSPLSPRSPD